MTVPAHIAASLAERGSPEVGVLALDRVCVGAKYHSPNPLVLHEVTLRDDSVVLVCGTCSDNIDVMWHLLTTGNGRLDWAVRREFGNDLRALALRGWSTTEGPEG